MASEMFARVDLETTLFFDTEVSHEGFTPDLQTDTQSTNIQQLIKKFADNFCF